MNTFPTYVGLGAQKAGTTLLHSWLRDHPEVCVPTLMKEANFFDQHYDRGLDWYRELFQPAGELAAGEFSVRYLESRRALSRIARDLPEVRCLVSLRDPVRRFDSEYRHVVKFGGYSGDRKAFMAERPRSIERGRYGRQLSALFDLFPAERVRVFVFEDVVRDPATAARGLYEFVGVDDRHRPGSLEARINPSSGARWPALDRLARQRQELGVRRDMHWLLRLGRSSQLRRLRAFNDRPAEDSAPPIDTDLARQLRELYAEEVEVASRLLRRDLGGLWRAGEEAPAPPQPIG